MPSDHPFAVSMNTPPSSSSSGHSKTRQAYDMTIEKEEKERTAFEREFMRIKEIGFQKYNEELQAKKIEEMREELLRAMGLSEDDLAEMPAEQRSTIEQMIEDEIKRRLAAQALMNKDGGDSSPLQQMKAIKGEQPHHDTFTGQIALSEQAAGKGAGMGLLDPEMLRGTEEITGYKPLDKDD